MTVRAIAHAIVSRYPEAWRERYEAEVRGLIDDAGVRIRDLGELLHGLFTERAREYLTSDDNPARTARNLGFAAPIAGGIFVGAAYLLSLGIVSVTGTWSDPVQYAGFFVFCALLIVIAVLVHRGRKRSADRRLLAIPPDATVVLLPIVFVDVVLFATLTMVPDSYKSSSFMPDWFAEGYNFVWQSVFVGGLLSSLWPGKDLLLAFAALSNAESMLRMNEGWAESCREWNAKGVPSPLDDALIQIGKWTLERDSARERLRELGYRARFRSSAGLDDPPEPRS